MSTTTNASAIVVPNAPKSPSPSSAESSSPDLVSSLKDRIFTFEIGSEGNVDIADELTSAATAPSALASKATPAKTSSLNLTIKTIMTIVKNLLPKCAAPFVDLFDKKPGQLSATVKGTFPLPGNPPTSLIVDAQAQVYNRRCTTTTELSLGNNVSCTVQLVIPEDTQEENEPSIKLHSHIVTQLKQMLEKQKSILSEAHLEINEVLNLIAKLPTQDIRVDWNGEDGCAVLYVKLPGEAKLTVFIKSPTNYEQAFDNLPDFIRQLFLINPKEDSSFIKPLLKQNFIFRWDGAKSEFTFEFTSGARNVEIQELELEGRGYIGILAEWLTRGTKVLLPQAIRGRVNFETLSLEFEHKKSANAEFEKGLAFTVTPNSSFIFPFDFSIREVSFNSKTHAITLNYKAMKTQGTKEISLTTSGSTTLKKLNFDISSAEESRLPPAALPVPRSNSTSIAAFANSEKFLNSAASPMQMKPRELIKIPPLDFTIGTIMNVVKNILPASFSPFVDLFNKSGNIITTIDGQFPLTEKPSTSLDVRVYSSIQEGAGNTTGLKFELPGNVSCDVTLTIPRSASGDRRAPKELHPFILNQLKEVLQQKLQAQKQPLNKTSSEKPEVQKTSFENANIELNEVMNLIKQLPAQDIKVSWDGKTGNATLFLDLPGAAQLKIYIKSPTDYGQAFDNLPSFVRDVLSAHLKGIYPVIRPLLTQTFSFEWKGASSEFELKFESPQIVLIKKLVLKDKGALNTLAEKFIGNTKISLPRKILGKVNFKDLSLSLTGSKLDDKTGNKMDDKLSAEVDIVGFPNLNVSLLSVLFDPQSNAMIVNYDTLFRKGSLMVDLNATNLEAIDLEIGPTKESFASAQLKNGGNKPAAPVAAKPREKPAANASKASAKPAAAEK